MEFGDELSIMLAETDNIEELNKVGHVFQVKYCFLIHDILYKNLTASPYDCQICNLFLPIFSHLETLLIKRQKYYVPG